MNKLKISIFAVCFLLTTTVFCVTPKKVVIRGGTPCGNDVCYNVIKQKGQGSNMVLKCLGGGPNHCTITRNGFDEDLNDYVTNDITDMPDFDMAQYNVGLAYAQNQIVYNNVYTGYHTWLATNTTTNETFTFKVSWIAIEDNGYEMTLERL